MLQDFVAAIADTVVIWNVAAIAVVLMALPNLLGMFLYKEVKALTQDYWHSHDRA